MEQEREQMSQSTYRWVIVHNSDRLSPGAAHLLMTVTSVATVGRNRKYCQRKLLLWKNTEYGFKCEIHAR